MFRKWNAGGRVFTAAMDLIEQNEIAGIAGDGPGLSLRLSPPLSAAVAETSAAMLDGIAGFDRHLAWVQACRAEMIDELRVWSELTCSTAVAPGSTWEAKFAARRVLVSTVAAELRLYERTAETLIAESKALVHELHATMEALKAGEISYRHASALIGHAWSIPLEARAAFEAAVLEDAKTLTVSKFDRKARGVRERMHPDSIKTRHTTAVADRCVEFTPGHDGMAWIGANLPVERALGAYERVSDIAVGLQGPHETRTLAQLRADVFADLLIDGVTAPTDGTGDAPEPGEGDDAVGARGASDGRRASRRSPRGGLGSGIRARVFVTVPVMTLLGSSEEPGTLEGYGPIDADTARRLAGTASGFTRILTHPETGAVLSIGRTRYKVPKELRTWLRIRDETCRFPGCSRNAARCDLDHSHDWQFGGPTAHDNLAYLCPAHHALKHNTAWALKHAGGGTLDWTSPTAHRYTTQPSTRLPTSAPAARLPTDPPF